MSSANASINRNMVYQFITANSTSNTVVVEFWDTVINSAPKLHKITVCRFILKLKIIHI